MLCASDVYGRDAKLYGYECLKKGKLAREVSLVGDPQPSEPQPAEFGDQDPRERLEEQMREQACMCMCMYGSGMGMHGSGSRSRRRLYLVHA